MKPDEKSKNSPVFQCPVPIGRHSNIQLAHGGGGRLTHQLIEKLFLPAFRNDLLEKRHDGALIELDGHRLAFTTDSYVVRPLFFPGGDIGKLAVNGTVNDLAMCGAKPLYLSVGFILEEGLPLDTLGRVVMSMREAAERAHIQVVTGDTKVVDRGKADGIFINTTGIGIMEHDQEIGPASVKTGDAILLSGDIGRHGIAILAVREGLEFESTIESDCAPVAKTALSLLNANIPVHCLRDLTRGGLASALIEIAESASVHILIEEEVIPARDDVRGACEILGFDPIYVANEGRFVAFVAQEYAQQALQLLRSQPFGDQACFIGSVVPDKGGLVTVKSRIGTTRIVDMLSGEQLPRIC